MAKGDQINLKPHFRKEGDRLPCEAETGDLYVFSPLNEGAPDPNSYGSASLWFCTKGSDAEGRSAAWARVHLEGVVTCAVPVPKPPPLPDLREG